MIARLLRLLIVSSTFVFCTNGLSARVKIFTPTIRTVDSTYIFTYSSDARSGLHLAVSPDNRQWTEFCSLLSSDYGSWGGEKRMFSPFIFRESENSWKIVWQVNDYAPCFAVSVSSDLMNWRPQDFPRMKSSGCLSPIIQFNGTSFDVLFKSKDGVVQRTETSDFRHFSDSKEVSSEIYNPHFDVINMNGRQYVGQIWRVSNKFFHAIERHKAEMTIENDVNSERLADDKNRFSSVISSNNPVEAKLIIDGQKRKRISDKLIGVFFEDISYAADGGLYAEMVQNGDFEYSKEENSRVKSWGHTFSWSSADSIKIDTVEPLSKNNPHYAVIKGQQLINSGWDGMFMKRSDEFVFSMYVRCLEQPAMTFRISLRQDGKLLDSKILKMRGRAWTKLSATLTPTDYAENATLSIEPMKKGNVAVDMVSLMPQNTFKGHGLRNDLAQVIANLHPKFMRFPGGCMSHGDGLNNIYRWIESIGPLQNRVPARNIWGYHQTRGLGFYEFFQFCEDLGCEPLPVLAAGVPCQNSSADSFGFAGQQGGIPMTDMPQYIQDLLDLIEWANGDPATSKWAKMRADAGHPAPFNLHYIGIGNEDLVSTVFEERYLMICKAIRAKYPSMIICGTVGPFHKGSSDYAEGWKIASENKNVIDMVDEHYYESTGWFMHHQHYYDGYDRSAPKVYLGEYAASTRVKRSNVETALSEALHLCNVERNADVVSMTSYAPLLAKDHHNNWNPDLIYFGNNHVNTTPSYETQRLFSKYSGDEYIFSKMIADSSVAYRIAYSVVYDSKSGNTYLKVVNMLPASVKLSIDLSSLSVSPVSTEGYNGLPDAQRVTMDDEQVSMDGKIARVTLKPYSLQVISLR